MLKKLIERAEYRRDFPYDDTKGAALAAKFRVKHVVIFRRCLQQTHHQFPMLRETLAMGMPGIAPVTQQPRPRRGPAPQEASVFEPCLIV